MMVQSPEGRHGKSTWVYGVLVTRVCVSTSWTFHFSDSSLLLGLFSHDPPLFGSEPPRLHVPECDVVLLSLYLNSFLPEGFSIPSPKLLTPVDLSLTETGPGPDSRKPSESPPSHQLFYFSPLSCSSLLFLQITSSGFVVL